MVTIGPLFRKSLGSTHKDGGQLREKRGMILVRQRKRRARKKLREQERYFKQERAILFVYVCDCQTGR
jgi:hypothetical protein